MNLRKWHVYRTRLWSLTPHVPLTAINRRGRSPPFVVGMSDCPDKNTYSQTLRLFVAFSDWRLEATTHMKLKSLKGRHNNYLILTHSQVKQLPLFFFSFYFFFFLKSRLVYLFWNVITGCWMGGGAPFAHMSYFIKGRFLRVCLQGIILSSLNSQMTGWYWNLSFFSVFTSSQVLCEAVKGGMCCDGRCVLVQTEPAVCRPTVTCRQRAKNKERPTSTPRSLCSFFPPIYISIC